MTDDNEAAVQSATNATTTRVNGNPGGRGNPRGRNRCSGCGAEGVNILTCPGDGQPHEATTEYREKLAQGPRPESQRVNPPGPAPQTISQATTERDNGLRPGSLDDVFRDTAQAMVAVLRDADETPVARAQTPRQDDRFTTIPVSRVTVQVVTAYPALAQASLEACVEDLAEAIWVGSHIQDLT